MAKEFHGLLACALKGFVRGELELGDQALLLDQDEVDHARVVVIAALLEHRELALELGHNGVNELLGGLGLHTPGCDLLGLLAQGSALDLTQLFLECADLAADLGGLLGVTVDQEAITLVLQGLDAGFQVVDLGADRVRLLFLGLLGVQAGLGFGGSALGGFGAFALLGDLFIEAGLRDADFGVGVGLPLLLGELAAFVARRVFGPWLVDLRRLFSLGGLGLCRGRDLGEVVTAVFGAGELELFRGHQLSPWVCWLVSCLKPCARRAIASFCLISASWLACC